LAWLLHKDRVSSVIFGARTEEQLSANLQAAKVKLNSDQMARLDGVSAEPLRYPYDFMHRIQGRW
jgi:aryl-alcohol dehydrogenase-like predicted oxidoreductase